jgi:4-amino-4-deoxy-L-arabinose transferase-like glycosyltransferase
LVPTDGDVFGTVPGLQAESAGFRLDPHDSDRVYSQGNHLLPALLAVGGWVAGPEVLLRINALIGAMALLAVFGLARRFIGGPFALAAVAALGLSLPMLQFSRDNYTEPLTLLLLFGGLSLLWRALQTHRRSQFFVAGVTIGSTAMARIDAYAALLAVIVAVVAMLAAAPAGERRAWLARSARS